MWEWEVFEMLALKFFQPVRECLTLGEKEDSDGRFQAE